MIVSRSSFDEVVQNLRGFHEKLSVDTETTGLRPHHGDRLFSIIIASRTELPMGGNTQHHTGYYFNFQPYSGLAAEFVLGGTHMDALRTLFADPNKTWYLHNAKFDLAMLAKEGIEVAGTVHCTKALGLVEYNEYQDYDLGSSLERIGLKKDATVDHYIDEHKLYDKIKIKGKKTEETLKHFDRVPWDTITPYGCADATGTLALGLAQEDSIRKQDEQRKDGVPPLSNVLANERRLTKTVFRMEQVGVHIDREYCVRAALYEADRAAKSTEEFKKITGRDYQNSSKLFEQVFADEKQFWGRTKPSKTHPTGQPSFKSDFLKNFVSPAAKLVLVQRDAKSKEDFYNGFLHHADSNGNVHPNFNPDGAGHGRFSSSAPNFQNLTAEDSFDCLDCFKAFEDMVDCCPDCGSKRIQAREFLVRKAIIPRPGFLLIMPDYDQMEYRFMLELACKVVGFETALVKKIKGGLDVHSATAEIASITRGEAKTTNFLTLYGGGNAKLALGLKCSIDNARRIRNSIFDAAPEIRAYTNLLMRVAEQRGFIVNWLGRRCHFPHRDYAYCAPNYHVAGGCADVNKVALNRIDERLLGMKSRLIMTVHDENPIEVHESEIHTVPAMVKEIMETVYPSKYLPLTTGMEWSPKSLGHKIKGFPV